MWLRNCWQVAAFAHEVIGGQLLARRICDESIVLFRALDGRAIAFEDRCPHRYAPLSKGTLIGDVLRCGYHGLCYDTSGKCVQIPGRSTFHRRRACAPSRSPSATVWSGSGWVTRTGRPRARP
jgi:vanillate O-demethylase monooxygenase subunit